MFFLIADSPPPAEEQPHICVFQSIKTPLLARFTGVETPKPNAQVNVASTGVFGRGEVGTTTDQVPDWVFVLFLVLLSSLN